MKADSPLEVIIEKKCEGSFLVMPVGQIDTETSAYFEEKIRSILTPSIKSIVFDMSKVDYICSLGLIVIFNTKKSVEAHSGTLALTNLQPQIKKVFEIIKALPPQSIFESVEEADSYLDAIQRKEIERQKEKGQDLKGHL